MKKKDTTARDITRKPNQIKTSGDENHLCGASLHESHKISLNAVANVPVPVLEILRFKYRQLAHQKT